MRRRWLLGALLPCIRPYVFSQENKTFNLMPVPAEVSTGAGELKLDRNFTLQVQADPNDSILWSGVNRLLQTLKKTTSLPLGQTTVTPASTAAAGVFKIKARKPSVLEVGHAQLAEDQGLHKIRD